MDNKIESKLNELIELLEGQEEVIRYRQIEEKMKHHDELRDKVAEYKKKQQKVVLYENKDNDVPEEVDERLDKMYNDLLDIPIFNEYSYLLTDINDVIQQIVLILEKELNQAIE